MFRHLALCLALALLPAAATADAARPLDTALRAYVDAFDLGAVPDTARARLRAIVAHDSASHVAKVLAIHDILQTHGALRHVDMHGDSPLQLSDLR
ncbi:hypothetical protein [Maliponia aquimaris]|uniref:Uncharacterized protein n=1 Tax=Maliponia aquimaris TaxID=1673631 RepID=A0A238L0S1_9RHOB|nr:hypothetical protein [Maliponia aquimaris]SMX48684.1 hypothetical protein MAA8898_04041 [Maliponia aquimaris]